MPLAATTKRPHDGGLRLVGPAHQRAGGVWVVDTVYERDRLLERLTTDGEVFGLDLETVGVDPRKQSPAMGKGRIVVWSCAFFDERLGTHPDTGYPLAQRVYVKNWGEAEDGRWLYKFQGWLENNRYKKVGANFFGFDRHVLANYGISVQGVIFDNVRASRLNDPSSFEHDLKTQGTKLGYVMREYKDLFGRPYVKRNGEPGKKIVLVPLTEVVQDSAWLETLIDYASLDAKVSLEAYPPLADQLKEKAWLGGRNMLDFYNTRLNPYFYVLNGAEQAGWDLDERWCAEQAVIADRDQAQCERKLVEWAGVMMNFGSPKQLGHFLYGDEPSYVVKANKELIPGKGFPVPPVKRATAHGMTKRSPGKRFADTSPEQPTDHIALNWLVDHVRSKRDREGLRTLLEWRKIKDTKKYLVGLPNFQDAKTRVHCQIGPDTETGRLAARNPALQQIPKPGKDAIADRYMVREAFTCPRGYSLICADYSQLEMRLLAHYLIVLFDDHRLADDLKAADLHGATAIRVFGRDEIEPDDGLVKDGMPELIKTWADIEPFTAGEAAKLLNELPGLPRDTPVKAVKKFFPSFRDKGKIVNFSVNYGKTAYGLGRDLKDADGNPIGDEAAQAILDAYFTGYPAIKRYKKWSISYAQKNGYARTLLGRYRPLPGIWIDDRGVRGHAERQAQNTPIQGSAADVAMMAQLKTNTVDIPELRELGFYDEELARMGVVHIMQIHDELVFRVPSENRHAARDRVREIMENPLDKPLTVPLPVDAGIGQTWAEAKE